MADNLDDGEFWLPPKFLNDDDTSFDIAFNPKNGDVSKALFPYLTSPVDSESDEEEQHLAELTRQMARSTLGLDLTEKPKGELKSVSPQSTLSAIGSSGKGSSPNDAVSGANSQEATWDLLNAAAGEVERMRRNDEQRYGFVKPAHGVGFYSQQQPSLSQHQQLQIAQFEMLRQQQMAKLPQPQGAVWACGGVQGRSDQMVVPNRGRNNVRGGGGVMGLSASAWPPLQNAKHQQFGSGMRAVFLENPSVEKERTGTGVFLPRSVNAPSGSRKKPGCSTVLVPDRVAQALNLNLDGMVGRQRNQHHRVNGISNIQNASAVPKIRSSYGASQQKQKQNLRPQPQPQVNHEIRLPQDWTY